MKVRNGFVSNSSSSSFILKFSDRFPDTVSIAESMLKNKYADYGYDSPGEDWWKASQARALKNIKRIKKEEDQYIPIYFTTCNYNTYIIPITNNYCFIDTCNNTRWDIEEDPGIQNKMPEEVLEKYPASEGFGRYENYICLSDKKDEDGESIAIIYDEEFYLIEHGILMRKPPAYKTCNKCYSDIWIIKNKEFCMSCDHDKIMRGLKINKIKNAFT